MTAYLGIHRNTMGKWLRGERVPSRRTLIAWALRTGVAFDWLDGRPSPDDGGPVSGEAEFACTPRLRHLAVAA